MTTRRRFFQSATALSLAGLAPVHAAPEKRRIVTGQAGTQHGHAAGKMETLRRLSEEFTVAGLAGAGEKADNAFTGIPRMEYEKLLELPGLEAVVVETDFKDACETAHRAIRAGKHVHLDKPGALDHAAFKAMRTEVAERRLVLQMGYMLRYNPAFQLAARAVKEEWLGQITEIDAMMGKQLTPAGRRELSGLPGGGLFELGCHLIDAVCGLIGKPAKVHPFSAPPGPDGLKDNQLAILEYPRAVATVRCNMIDPFGFPRRRFQITGTKGSMEIAPLESGKITLRLTEARGDYAKGEQQVALPVPQGRYDAELTAFAAAIRGGPPLPWDAAHDIAVHETVLRASGAWE